MPREVTQLQAAVDRAFAIVADHAAKEMGFVTPAVRACAPALAADSDAEHHEQERRLGELKRLLAPQA